MSQIEVDKIIPQSGTNTQLGESGDTITIPAGATITNNGTADGFGSADTEKVKVSSNDTTAGFLNGKLVAGTNISLTEGSDGGDETLTAAFTGTIGTSQIADSAVTTAKLGNSAVDLTSKVTGALPVANGGTNLTSGFKNGITMADQWRWTANFTGNAQPITANWERNDTSFDKIGTGMTESSGIFTFPQTGIYKINTGAFYYLNSNSRYNEIVIELSTNGGSNWTSIAYGYTSISNNTGSSTYASASTEAIVDVTNASNFKLVISVSHHDTNTTVAGNSGRNDNFTTFVRLGDT